MSRLQKIIHIPLLVGVASAHCAAQLTPAEWKNRLAVGAWHLDSLAADRPAIVTRNQLDELKLFADQFAFNFTADGQATIVGFYQADSVMGTYQVLADPPRIALQFHRPNTFRDTLLMGPWKDDCIWVKGRNLQYSYLVPGPALVPPEWVVNRSNPKVQALLGQYWKLMRGTKWLDGRTEGLFRHNGSGEFYAPEPEEDSDADELPPIRFRWNISADGKHLLLKRTWRGPTLRYEILELTRAQMRLKPDQGPELVFRLAPEND